MTDQQVKPDLPGRNDENKQPRREFEALLTRDQAAGLVLMTPERIAQLARDGWIKRQGKQYRLVDVVHGYLRFARDDARRNTKVQAASRVSDARARQIELANAQKEGELILFAEHIETVDKMAGVVRAKLGGISVRVTRDLELRKTIETAINEVLNELSDICIASAGKLGAPGAVTPAEESNDA